MYIQINVTNRPQSKGLPSRCLVSRSTDLLLPLLVTLLLSELAAEQQTQCTVSAGQLVMAI